MAIVGIGMSGLHTGSSPMASWPKNGVSTSIATRAFVIFFSGVSITFSFRFVMFILRPRQTRTDRGVCEVYRVLLVSTIS
ncbi:hypothetical protein ES703_105546 [subsurface metagenome]